MKRYPFAPFILAAGLAGLLVLAVTAQGADMKTAEGAPRHNTSAGRMVPYPGYPNAVSLSNAPAITFTPSFTIYVPLIQSSPPSCSVVPTLVSPANGSTLDNLIPLFEWNSGNNPNATTLRLEVARDSGFTQLVHSLFSGSVQGAGQFRFTRNLDPATTYYWRAFLECGEGVRGPYSEVWSFTAGSGGTILPAPDLVAPADGTILPSTSVTLQWSPVSGAVEYRVHWRRSGTGGSTYRRTTDTQALISGLSASTTYEWWSAARNDYAWSNESAHWTFTTGPSGSLASPGPSPASVSSGVIEDDGMTIMLGERYP